MPRNHTELVYFRIEIISHVVFDIPPLPKSQERELFEGMTSVDWVEKAAIDWRKNQDARAGIPVFAAVRNSLIERLLSPVLIKC